MHKLRSLAALTLALMGSFPSHGQISSEEGIDRLFTYYAASGEDPSKCEELKAVAHMKYKNHPDFKLDSNQPFGKCTHRIDGKNGSTKSFTVIQIANIVPLKAVTQPAPAEATKPPAPKANPATVSQSPKKIQLTSVDVSAAEMERKRLEDEGERENARVRAVEEAWSREQQAKVAQLKQEYEQRTRARCQERPNDCGCVAFFKQTPAPSTCSK